MSETEKVLSVKERLALLNNKSSDSNNSTPKKEENKTVIGSTIKDRISALQSPTTTSIPIAATPPSSFISSNTVKSESSSRSSISEKIAQLQSSPSHIPSPIVSANPPESIVRNSISEKIAQLQSSSSAIPSSPATPSSSESTGRSSISEKIAQLQSSTLLQSPPASAPSSSESTGRSSISEKIAQLQSSSTPNNNNTISGTAITNQDDSTNIHASNIPNIESISIKGRVANLHSSTLTSADDTNNTGHKIPDRRKSAKISELGANINISFLMGKPLPRSSIIGSPTMIMDINDDNATIEKVTAVDSTGGIVHLNLTRATRSKKPSSNSKKFVALADDD